MEVLDVVELLMGGADVVWVPNFNMELLLRDQEGEEPNIRAIRRHDEQQFDPAVAKKFVEEVLTTWFSETTNNDVSGLDSRELAAHFQWFPETRDLAEPLDFGDWYYHVKIIDSVS